MVRALHDAPSGCRGLRALNTTDGFERPAKNDTPTEEGSRAGWVQGASKEANDHETAKPFVSVVLK